MKNTKIKIFSTETWKEAEAMIEALKPILGRCVLEIDENRDHRMVLVVLKGTESQELQAKAFIAGFYFRNNG